jgi:hypothetical protein
MGTMGAGPVASCRSVIALSTPGLDSRPRKPSIRRIAPRGSAASSRWWTSGKRSSPRRALAPTSGAGLSWASRATLSSSTSRPWRKSPGPKSDRPGRYSDVLHGAGVGSMRATGSRAFSQAASYQGHATFACSAQRRLRPSRLLGSGQRTPAGRNWMLIRGPSVRDRLGTLCSHVR